MYPTCSISCTECTKRSSLHDYITRAFERIDDFWQGHEGRPVINRKIIPAIFSAADDTFDANFKQTDNVYASMEFKLDTGILVVTFYPYPNSVSTDGNKFPAFNLPVDVYRGKWAL